MITSVLFDVGGVLAVVDDNWPQQWLSGVAATADLPFHEVLVRLESAELPDTRVADDTEGLYMAEFGRALGLDPEQNRAVFASMWDHYCGRPNTPMLEFAASLKGHYRLGILSNSADGAHREEEKRYRFSETFDPVMYSHKIGLEKPDPALFSYACQRLEAAPSEVLFIDDIPEVVEAADAFGIATVHYVDADQAIAEARRVLAVS